jgi:hypothetical protein
VTLHQRPAQRPAPQRIEHLCTHLTLYIPPASSTLRRYARTCSAPSPLATPRRARNAGSAPVRAVPAYLPRRGQRNEGRGGEASGRFQKSTRPISQLV